MIITKYKFKAIELKTSREVYRDLAYFVQNNSKKEKTMIVNHRCHGGIIWTRERHFIDENTIGLIKEE